MSYKELVKRLRTAADTSVNGGGEWFQLVHRCREAADALEAQARRIEELEAALGRIANEPEVHTKLNQERLCCKFQDIALAAIRQLKERT